MLLQKIKIKKIWAKEWRLKRYQDRVNQYKQNRIFQNNEKISYKQFGGKHPRTYQQVNKLEAKELKYGKEKNLTEWPNG